MPPVVVVTLAVETRGAAAELAAAISEAGALRWDAGTGPGSAMVLEARAVNGEWAPVDGRTLAGHLAGLRRLLAGWLSARRR
jgi:hypothetical protein